MPRCLQVEGSVRSAHLSTRSTPRKKLDQEKNRSVRLGQASWPSRKSSPMPRAGSIARTGLKCDMMDHGTTIVRVHADIALKLKFRRDGIRTISGGTLGH